MCALLNTCSRLLCLCQHAVSHVFLSYLNRGPNQRIDGQCFLHGVLEMCNHLLCLYPQACLIQYPSYLTECFCSLQQVFDRLRSTVGATEYMYLCNPLASLRCVILSDTRQNLHLLAFLRQDFNDSQEIGLPIHQQHSFEKAIRVVIYLNCGTAAQQRVPPPKGKTYHSLLLIHRCPCGGLSAHLQILEIRTAVQPFFGFAIGYVIGHSKELLIQMVSRKSVGMLSV